MNCFSFTNIFIISCSCLKDNTDVCQCFRKVNDAICSPHKHCLSILQHLSVRSSLPREGTWNKAMLFRSPVFPVLKNCTQVWALTSGHRTTRLGFNSEELLVFAGHHLCMDNGKNDSATDQQYNKFVMATHRLSLSERSSVVDACPSVSIGKRLISANRNYLRCFQDLGTSQMGNNVIK